MRIIMSVFVFIIAGFLLLAPVGAADFSADMVSSSPQGSIAAKLYVSGQKSRVEMPGATTISRTDKKVMWMLMPQEKMYIEQPIGAYAAMSTEEKLDGEIERKGVARETVNGMNAVKYRVTYESAGKRDTIFQWIDDVTHFPVKTSAADGSWWSEFRNVKAGPQDQALFEIPPDYHRMALNMPDAGPAR